MATSITCGTLTFQPLGLGTNKWGTDPLKPLGGNAARVRTGGMMGRDARRARKYVPETYIETN